MNSGKRHKHRRSNSTTLQQHKQNDTKCNQQIITEPNLIDISVAATTVMQCIQNTNYKNPTKLTIVEELDHFIDTRNSREKKIKCLQQIQKDLINWDQFQGNFLHVKLNRKMQPQSIRHKKKKANFQGDQIFQSQQQAQKFWLGQKQLFKKKNLRVK